MDLIICTDYLTNSTKKGGLVAVHLTLFIRMSLYYILSG